jgi:hypothetical protein
MLLDISGNTFSTLGPSVPTRLIGPRELFGDSLQVHVDTTDYRNLFTTNTGSTNVSLTGQSQVKRIEDISGKGRKFYYFSGSANGNAFESLSFLAPESFTSTTINQFSGSSFDTNKGVLYNGQFCSPLNPTFVTAPQSAATVCFYGWYGGSQANQYVIGLGRSYSFSFALFGFETHNSNIFRFYTNSVLRFTGNSTPYVNKNIMLLGTISGNSYSIYINDNLISSGTMTGSLYPISASAGNSGGYALDADQSTYWFAGNSTTIESFISHSYTTPEQAKLLYNYFITKFKNKVERFR